MLEQICGPSDLKKLDIKQLTDLCQEIREHLIATVTSKGGHLASNLGVVELTVALHYVFDIEDKFVWDVGHQSYVHKLLTGRYYSFDTLRQKGGVSGFCDPAESAFDAVVSGHAGTSISSALGLATARDLDGKEYNVVAVVGDGALTNGETYEALNNLKERKMLVVLNDNGMSIGKNVGSISKNMSRIRVGKYDIRKQRLKNFLHKVPLVGKPTYKLLRATKRRLKWLVLKNNYFESFDVKYVGVIDGHDLKELIYYLEKIKKNVDKPCVLHVSTKKGKGYAPAEENQELYHNVYTNHADKLSSNVVGDALCDVAACNGDVVAVCAAMKDSVGLSQFATKYPERSFDVGIAESHAVTFAGGLAANGKKPYVLIYSTFMQRAYDQILHDVAIANLPVTFLLDRSGFSGADGKTHQGLQDLSYLTNIPNMTVLTPCCYSQLNQMVKFSSTFDAPLAIRYGKTLLEDEISFDFARWNVLTKQSRVKLLAVGKNMVKNALQVANNLPVEVVCVTSVKPLDVDYLSAISCDDVVVTLEENQLLGGFGSAVNAILKNVGCTLVNLGVDDCFVEHATVTEQIADAGLDATSIENIVKKYV